MVYPHKTGRHVSSASQRGGIFFRSKSHTRNRRFLNIFTMAIATGMIATMSLPAFAFDPHTVDAQSMNYLPTQNVSVSGQAQKTVVTREDISATSAQDLTLARQQAAASLASSQAAFSGPSVSDFLANPPYPNFSLDDVFAVAQRYQGVPYVLGGASPAGFDCSGLVMYVYAQFGIALPHSVTGQAARGKRIAREDARPGDLVIMPGHNGFYAGNGRILDAPDYGRSVMTRDIWTSNYYIVRLGI